MFERIRGRALQRIRAAHFSRDPLCVICMSKGRITLATDLDHIVALVNGGKDVEDNRQGLCADCHKDKTAQDMGHKQRAKFDAQGRVIW
jgi:5-methylcytosine-specific restriction protein A